MLYNNMLSKITNFVKSHLDTILLFLAVAVIVLFAFGCGYIIAKYQEKTPIQIHENT